MDFKAVVGLLRPLLLSFPFVHGFLCNFLSVSLL